MKIGCNMYGLRYELDEMGAEAVINKLSECGITSIEPFFNTRGADLNEEELKDFWPDDVTSEKRALMWTKGKIKELMPLLKEKGMEISSVHASRMGDIETNAQAYIKLYQEIGIGHVVVSKKFYDKKSCEEVAEAVNKLNRLVKAYGVTIVYHNHAEEGKEIEIDGRKITLLEYFVTLADKEIKLEVDAGWLLRAGHDPIECLKRLEGRVVFVHFKDIVADHQKKNTEDIFTAVGNGILPTKQLLELCKTLPLVKNGIIIDQDAPGEGSDMLTDIRNGVSFMKKLE